MKKESLGGLRLADEEQVSLRQEFDLQMNRDTSATTPSP